MHVHELTLGLAFGLGALHALEPGHGKTAMLLYLAGERRSFLHPLVMGLASALSHSISLIGIAAIVHLTHHIVSGDHYHPDESVTDAMRWISAGLVLLVGLWMLWSASRPTPTQCGCSSHQLHDHHNHDHEHDHESGQHDKGQNEIRSPEVSAEPLIQLNGAQVSPKTSYSMSALLGAAFGLMPCPSAMAAYFSSLSLGSPVNAYLVIGLFAAGIAFSLTVVGVAVQIFGNRLTKNRHARPSRLPWAYIRAGLIILIGLFYLAHVAFG